MDMHDSGGASAADNEKVNEITEVHINRLVHTFYDNVRIDPVIGPVFHAAVHDWPEHLDKLTRFWCSIMLAARTYKGNPLAVHFDIPIRPDMFDRWLDLWAETADSIFNPDIAQQFKATANSMGSRMRFALFGREGVAK